MSERITSVSAALELLVPPFAADGGNWAEIVEKAAPPPRRRRRRLILAVAIALTLLASAPAWSGSGYGPILHFLTGKPSKKVDKLLAQFGEDQPPGQAVHPIVAKTRKVYERHGRYGTFRIWLTPTKEGGVCETLEGPTQHAIQPYSAGCGAKTPQHPIEVSGSGSGGGGDFFRGELDGRVQPRIRGLELRYVNGGHEQIPLQNGFFATGIAAVRTQRVSDHPAELVGRDRDGHVVARFALGSFYEDFQPGMGRPPIAEAKRERPLLRAPLEGGTSVELLVSPARGGGTCGRLVVAGSTWTWTCVQRPVRHPVRIGLLRAPVRSGAAVVLYGSVQPGVKLQFRFEDGTARTIPTADDYFLVSLPKARWTPGRRLSEIVARADGRVVLRVPVARRGAAFYSTTPDRRPEFGHAMPRKPPAPASALHGKVQRGRAGGVSVEANAKGRVNFFVSRTSRAFRLLSGTSVGYGCLHVRHAGPPWDVDEMTVLLRFAPSGRVSVWAQRPFDGCEIQGGYGHHWRDRYGTHSAAEVPFDAVGRRFFAERATARDLANLVRSAAFRTLRRKGAAAPAARVVARFGSPIDALRSPGERPPPGRIGYWARGNRAVLSEIAPTGTRFFIVLVDGHVAQSNVAGLTQAL
jgi:hypothetical protein